MNIAAVFVAYFGIKETQFHPDTCAWRGQYIYVYVCVQTNVCVPLYSAKGIDDVALNKK